MNDFEFFLLENNLKIGSFFYVKNEIPNFTLNKDFYISVGIEYEYIFSCDEPILVKIQIHSFDNLENIINCYCFLVNRPEYIETSKFKLDELKYLYHNLRVISLKDKIDLL